MFNPDEVLGNPLTRSPAVYNFAVTKIQGNIITYRDASGVERTIDGSSLDGVLPIEEVYGKYLGNLFLAININGGFFLYQKLSNDRIL